MSLKTVCSSTCPLDNMMNEMNEMRRRKEDFRIERLQRGIANGASIPRMNALYLVSNNGEGERERRKSTCLQFNDYSSHLACTKQNERTRLCVRVSIFVHPCQDGMQIPNPRASFCLSPKCRMATFTTSVLVSVARKSMNFVGKLLL